MTDSDPQPDHDYRAALLMGLRRAGFHWLRAGYEVVAGWGALLSEVAAARNEEADDDDNRGDQGPVRIELD